MKSALPYQQPPRHRTAGRLLVGSVLATALATLLATLLCGAMRSAAAAESSSAAGADEEVTITTGADRTVFEYRQNGQLRMVKVVPAAGKPYYLVPADPTRGTGDLEHAGRLVPSWRIVEF